MSYDALWMKTLRDLLLTIQVVRRVSILNFVFILMGTAGSSQSLLLALSSGITPDGVWDTVCSARDSKQGGLGTRQKLNSEINSLA